MNAEAFAPFIDALAEALAPKVAAALAKAPGKNPNELLTVAQIAEELHLRKTAVGNLIRGGALHRAPDIKEMRVKRSVVDAYGKPKEAK